MDITGWDDTGEDDLPALPSTNTARKWPMYVVANRRVSSFDSFVSAGTQGRVVFKRQKARLSTRILARSLAFAASEKKKNQLAYRDSIAESLIHLHHNSIPVWKSLLPLRCCGFSLVPLGRWWRWEYPRPAEDTMMLPFISFRRRGIWWTIGKSDTFTFCTFIGGKWY